MSTPAPVGIAAIIHQIAPHSDLDFYIWNWGCGLLFAVIGGLIAHYRHKSFQLPHLLAHGSGGATFPTFLWMPFVPFDPHLSQAIYSSWVNVALAGLIGMGVTLYSLWVKL